MSEELEEVLEEVPQRRDFSEELIKIIRNTSDEDELRAKLDDYHYNDLAEVWEELTKEEHIRLYNILGAEEVSEIFAYFEDEASKYLIGAHSYKAFVSGYRESYNSIITKIDFKLKEIFYLMLLNSVITFVINMVGISILILKPAGEDSRFMALGIFSINFSPQLTNSSEKFFCLRKDFNQNLSAGE